MRIFQIAGESDERRDEDYMMEKAFKEGCEHGYKKAMKEMNYSERMKSDYREGFEEKIKRLKEKYK